MDSSNLYIESIAKLEYSSINKLTTALMLVELQYIPFVTLTVVASEVEIDADLTAWRILGTFVYVC